MRMRHKPYARPELAAWPRYVPQPDDLRGQWASFFDDPTKPLRVELGCGKGGFLAQLALRNTGYNYLGVDIKSEMLVVAKRTIERLYANAGQQPGNIAITSRNIEQIEQTLATTDRVHRVYINFCNPWYKTGYAKHRLTHTRQLFQVRQFLPEGGEVWFKTDDTPLFEDSLRYFAHAGFEVTWLSRDLHRGEPAWNIRTEHENMFAAEGVPIKACIAGVRPAQLERAAIFRLKNI